MISPKTRNKIIICDTSNDKKKPELSFIDSEDVDKVI